MPIWIDPIVPKIEIPSKEELLKDWHRLGSKRFRMTAKQWEFIKAQEEIVISIGGFGSAKTQGACIKSVLMSMLPRNRGIVGILKATDLEATAQRDLLDWLKEAELLAKAPDSRKSPALVHCVDLETNRNTGEYSEIEFVHLDDPDHLRGRKVGWFWMDEAHKTKRQSFVNLMGRMRLKHMEGYYKAMLTSNSGGKDWLYDMGFNEELITQMICGNPRCTLSNEECNRRLRLKRRAIHSTSWDNWFLPAEYIDNMVASFSEEERQREIEGSFDVFEGQIHKEWDSAIHCFNPPKEWAEHGGEPPPHWPRLLAVDVGGASPWCFLFSAVDPMGNVVVYDEIYKITTDVELLATLARPKLSLDGRPLNFKAKVIDYENKIAAEDLRRRGITMTNAAKHGKAGSITRLSGYLHPNPNHHFPEWHPKAGQPKSPRIFFSWKCRETIKEIPQQRWKEITGGGSFKDEPDRTISNHGWDATLYSLRQLPAPHDLKADPGISKPKIDKRSQMYWHDVQQEAERNKNGGGIHGGRHRHRQMRARI